VREPAVRARLEDAIACTAEAGGEICIIHPDNDKSPEENAEMYGELLPFARSCGAKIATENMWNWDRQKDQATFAACATPESFCRHIDILEDDYMVACLDIGHAEMRGVGTSAVEMIKALDYRLQALHIHDNDKWHDSHQLPFTMDIDFAPIAKALKEIGYKGFYTLEVGPYMNVYDKETVTKGLQNLAASAKKFASMCTE
jgi:sugar phosphate isomerase/epimerase